MKEQLFLKNLASDLRPFKLTESLSSFLVRWSAYTFMILILAFLLLPARSDLSMVANEFKFHLENVLWLAASVSAGLAFYYSAFPQKMKFNYLIPTLFVLSLLLLLVLANFPKENIFNQVHEEMDLWRGRCGFIILTISAIHATFLGRWAKKAAPSNPSMTGFWATLSSSALGCLFMQVVCGHSTSLHLIIWHFLPLALICFGGQQIGKRYLRW